MEKSNLTPEKYLESKGIYLQKSIFIVYLDNCMRQPDLCLILQEYAELKCLELKNELKKQGEN